MQNKNKFNGLINMAIIDKDGVLRKGPAPDMVNIDGDDCISGKLFKHRYKYSHKQLQDLRNAGMPYRRRMYGGVVYYYYCPAECEAWHRGEAG